jgi:hypothetical protein
VGLLVSISEDVAMWVCLYVLMHSRTVGDNDPKPSQGGGEGPISGRRGVEPPIGVRGAARGVKRWFGHYTKYRKEAEFWEMS